MRKEASLKMFRKSSAINKTRNSIDVFLKTDGTFIPLGRIHHQPIRIVHKIGGRQFYVTIAQGFA